MYEAKYLGSLKAFTGVRDVLEALREGGRQDCATERIQQRNSS